MRTLWGDTPDQQGAPQMGLPSELALNDIIAQLAARVAQSQGAAAQAQTAFGNAAAAPEPNIYRDSPGRVAAGTGLARLAEGLGATDHPVERARHTIGAQQKSMSERRLENLRALHQNYESLAERADKLGDLEASVKHKSAADKVAREQQKIIDADKAESAMGLVRERNQGTLAATQERNKGTLAAAGIRARATADAAARKGAGAVTSLTNLDAKVEAVVNGEAKLFHFPTAERGEIVARIHSSGRRIIPDKARTAINELSAAETAIDEIDKLSKQLNTAKAGIDRFATGGKNRWNAIMQSGPAAELASTRGGLAGNLARAISAERGVLTDQDRKFAMGLIPSFDDAATIATNKIARLRRFLKSKREAALHNYSSDLSRGVKSGSSGGATGSSRTISKFGGPSTEPGPDDAHSQVMELLRAGNRDAVLELIKANPDLDEDPEINAVWDELDAAEAQ